MGFGMDRSEGHKDRLPNFHLRVHDRELDRMTLKEGDSLLEETVLRLEARDFPVHRCCHCRSLWANFAVGEVCSSNRPLRRERVSECALGLELKCLGRGHN